MDGLTALDGELGRIHALLADLDETGCRRPVLACPGWDVAEVVRHLGGVQRWATAIVVTGRDGSIDADEAAARAPDGRHPADLRAWFTAGAERLRAVLVAARPEQPCETLVGAGTADFWGRRQTHEAAVHAFDIARALGSAHEVETSAAVDGIDEVLTVLAPRQVRLGRTPALGGRVTVTALDAGCTWRLGRGEPSAGLAGPAGPLFLLLWGRLDLAEAGVRAVGDLGLVAAALRPGALTP